MEDKMKANTIQRKEQRNFLDIPTAAFEAGYSPRLSAKSLRKTESR